MPEATRCGQEFLIDLANALDTVDTDHIGGYGGIVPHLMASPYIPDEWISALGSLETLHGRQGMDAERRLQLAAALRIRRERGGEWPEGWGAMLTHHIPPSWETVAWAESPRIQAVPAMADFLLPSLSRLFGASFPIPRDTRDRILVALWNAWPDRRPEILSRIGLTEQLAPKLRFDIRRCGQLLGTEPVTIEAIRTSLIADLKRRLASDLKETREGGMSILAAVRELSLQPKRAALRTDQYPIFLVSPCEGGGSISLDDEQWDAQAAAASYLWEKTTRSSRSPIR